MSAHKIIHSDCIKAMHAIEDNSIDSCVTDPPYGLGFMGKEWDTFNALPLQQFTYQWATELYRILKPGAHILVFGGTRTYHRMACAIEDAGLEARDMIEWFYGGGFPKSLDIGKQIDKNSPRLKLFSVFSKHFRNQREQKGLTHNDIAKHFPSKNGGLTGCVWDWENAMSVPTLEQWKILQSLLDLSDKCLPLIERIGAEREVIGKKKKAELKGHVFFGNSERAKETGHCIGYGEFDVTTPATEQAIQWGGWGTGLKPAHEPILLARKPISERNITSNVLKWGVGGINVDECRIEYQTNQDREKARVGFKGVGWKHSGNTKEEMTLLEDNLANQQGRYHANLILDEEVGEMLDKQKSRFFYQPKASQNERWFYCTFCKRSDQIKNRDKHIHNAPSQTRYKHIEFHPTQKPIQLIQYLIRLITPITKTMIDPFLGSGTALIAAEREQVNCIGIDSHQPYCNIAYTRLKDEIGQATLTDKQSTISTEIGL